MATGIANTSPLQYLFQVGLVEVLRDLFGTVHVPVAAGEARDAWDGAPGRRRTS